MKRIPSQAFLQHRSARVHRQPTKERCSAQAMGIQRLCIVRTLLRGAILAALAEAGDGWAARKNQKFARQCRRMPLCFRQRQMFPCWSYAWSSTILKAPTFAGRPSARCVEAFSQIDSGIDQRRGWRYNKPQSDS